MKANYIIRQGESLHLYLIAKEGYIDGVDEVTTRLKKAGPNGTVPSQSEPVIATFTTSTVDLPDIGWCFTLEDEETQIIKPGFYIANAKLELTNGRVVKTEHVLIEVKGSVS